MIFWGLWTRLRVLWQNGQNLATKAWRVWSPHIHHTSEYRQQEANFSFTQFYIIWNRFSLDAWFTHGRCSRSHSLGFGNWSISFRTEQIRRTTEGATEKPVSNRQVNMDHTIRIKHTSVIPTNIDHIPSNTKNSYSIALLYVFEDNEVVIKMIIQGRSPTRRHWIGWFDRINLHPKVFKIRYIDTNTNSQTS